MSTQQQVKLVKEVFGRATYDRVIDTSFSELYTEVTGSVDVTLTVEDFFDAYEALFFQIPATGDVNSHEYLAKTSMEYLGGGVVTDTERAYIEEINALRQQLVEQSQALLDLNRLV